MRVFSRDLSFAYLFLTFINDLPGAIICQFDDTTYNTTIYIFQFYWFDKVKLRVHLGNNIQSCVYWVKKMLVNFNASKRNRSILVVLKKHFYLPSACGLVQTTGVQLLLCLVFLLDMFKDRTLENTRMNVKGTTCVAIQHNFNYKLS